MRETMISLGEKLIKKLVEKGADEAEFYGEYGRKLVLEISGGRVKRVAVKMLGNYGVRVAVDKRIASISSDDLVLSDIDRVAEMLISIARSSPRDESFPGFATGYKSSASPLIMDKRVAGLGGEEAVALLRDLIEKSVDAAKRSGAEEAEVTEGMFSAGQGGIVIMNSHGDLISGEGTSLAMYYDVKARRGGEESTYQAVKMLRRLSEDELMGEAEKAGSMAPLFIGASPVDSGEYTVLFGHELLALITKVALLPAFSAREVQQNRSPLKDRLGDKVLAETLVIRDMPHLDWRPGSRGFDDEGQATSTKAVVDKGVLKTFLYDTYTAARDNTVTTGNGFRRSPGSAPSPGFTNAVIEAEATGTWDELVAEIRRGLIAYMAIGYWMSKHENGAVQATLSHGFLVENGEVKRPVKGVVIGGNIYKWLGENLRGASKEAMWIGNVRTQAMLVDRVPVAGK